MKLKLSENQLEALAGILEKIGLALGIVLFLNGFIVKKPTVSLLEGVIFIVMSLTALTFSIMMRK